MALTHKPSERRMDRHKLNLAEFKMKPVSEDDYDEIITNSTLVFNAETRELEAVYLVLDDDCSDVERAIRAIEYDSTARLGDVDKGGMKTHSRVFGHQPRSLPRRDYCTSASLSRDYPAEHEIIAKYALMVSAYYREFNPERYSEHEQQTTKILDEWRLKSSPFTSGIVNKNNPLPYHFDTGNFTGVWSNMLAFKHGCSGGFLAMPEYRVAFAVPNNSLLMFDGQSILHGVTPFELRSQDAYRYTIVYYSLKRMWRCLPITDEIIRAQERRTEREYGRLAGIRKKFP